MVVKRKKLRELCDFAKHPVLQGKIIPSFMLGKRRVVDRLELDRYVEGRNAMARTESKVPEKKEIIVSLKK